MLSCLLWIAAVFLLISVELISFLANPHMYYSFLLFLKGAQKHLYLPMGVTATKAVQASKSAEANVLVIFPENCDCKDQRSLEP